ncbi:MAG: glycosyltransferase family 39 protein [Candidatus Coatesbacteria bacterium]|nr:MAG: glycosyltransferase family 39 protein [Candidatus Coatesbacteria bacterium]
MKKTEGRGWLRNVVGAGALALLAAGVFDLASLIAAFTPRGEVTGSALVIAGQIRWGAGVAAAALVLRAFGLFRAGPIVKLRNLLSRGSTLRWVLGIFIVALAVRLAYAAVAAAPPISDEQYYHGLARSLAAGQGYTAGGTPVAYWPVGYPALVAAFYAVLGSHYFPVILFQALLGAAAAAGLAWVGREFVSEGGARAAGLILALWPNQFAYAARLFPAVVLAFAVVALAYLYTRGRKPWVTAAAAGLVNGVAALLAPVTLVLPAAALASDLFRRVGWLKVLGRVALLIFVAAVVAAPWALRNWRLYGEFVGLSTNGGVNLWIGNNPNATGAYRYPTSRINPLFVTEGELERDRLGRELSWYFINHDREKFLMLALPKFVYTYGADISAFQYDDLGRGVDPRVSARRWPSRLAQGYYALAVLGFILGLAALRRRRRQGGWGEKLPLGTWLAWPVALTVVYLVFFGGGRFHFPMMAFVALLAGEAAASTREERAATS